MKGYEDAVKAFRHVQRKIEERINKIKSNPKSPEYETLLWVWALLEDVGLGEESNVVHGEHTKTILHQAKTNPS